MRALPSLNIDINRGLVRHSHQVFLSFLPVRAIKIRLYKSNSGILNMNDAKEILVHLSLYRAR